MRLINTATLQLEEFIDRARIPPYAILSHTWRRWRSELVAPLVINFYDQDWSFIGTRITLFDTIHQATGIDKSCLLGNALPSDFSIAKIMSWAAGRVTTRLEDQAYCPLGLFGVNMPLLYGEGEKTENISRDGYLDLSSEWERKGLGSFASSYSRVAFLAIVFTQQPPPPEALNEQTSMMAMPHQNIFDEKGRGLLVFKKRGSGRENGRYIGIYLEAALDNQGALQDWPRACRALPDWNIRDGLDAVAQLNERFPPSQAIWIDGVMVTMRTVVPVKPAHNPSMTVALMVEIVFDMARIAVSRDRTGSIGTSKGSLQHRLMLRLGRI
ncbi:HET domain-containing protein [Colletotrichum salicis]|uniref:HET domain-containing protein n=1 Tax=Colletotrichum salicis TaxID=1209931 RepID=A0A135T1P2_9PEZI|nr:HET domain-containing protein [Colletotrichum salicis]